MSGPYVEQTGEGGAAMSRAYPIGTRVKFVDTSATTSTGETVIASGMVNGQPAGTPGGALYVPVFVTRDNGRESTTAWVAESNIVEVT